MDDSPFDLSEDQRTYSRPSSNWLKWTLVSVLAAAIIVGIGTTIAFLRGWI